MNLSHKVILPQVMHLLYKARCRTIQHKIENNQQLIHMHDNLYEQKGSYGWD